MFIPPCVTWCPMSLSSPQYVESLRLLSRKSVFPNALYSFYSFTNEYNFKKKKGSHSTGFQTLVLPFYIEMVFPSDSKSSIWWSTHFWVLKFSVREYHFNSIKHQLLQCKLEACASRLTVYEDQSPWILWLLLCMFFVFLRFMVLQLYYTSTTVTDKYCNQLLKVK